MRVVKLREDMSVHKIPSLFSLYPSPLNPAIERTQLEDASLESNTFKGRSLKVETPTDRPEIMEIFNGNAAGNVDQLFFPVRSNSQTELVKEMVQSVIEDPTSVEFFFNPKKSEEVSVTFRGQSYDFYALLEKVKWDLVKLDEKLLQKHLENTQDFRLYTSIFNKNSLYVQEMIKPIPREKEYLYKDLHEAEIDAVRAYTYSSKTFNEFLRRIVPDYYLKQKVFVSYFAYVAVLCSALNKIPPSEEFERQKYAFRCIRNHKFEDGSTLIEGYTKKLDDQRKVKELGFTGVSFNKPQNQFLSGYDEDCLKVYSNPKKLAKDISGLSLFPAESECLLLPNTKEMLIREVVYQNDDYSKGKRHIFLSKLISKRQKVT